MAEPARATNPNGVQNVQRDVRRTSASDAFLVPQRQGTSEHFKSSTSVSARALSNRWTKKPRRKFTPASGRQKGQPSYQQQAQESRLKSRGGDERYSRDQQEPSLQDIRPQKTEQATRESETTKTTARAPQEAKPKNVSYQTERRKTPAEQYSNRPTTKEGRPQQSTRPSTSQEGGRISKEFEDAKSIRARAQKEIQGGRDASDKTRSRGRRKGQHPGQSGESRGRGRGRRRKKRGLVGRTLGRTPLGRGARIAFKTARKARQSVGVATGWLNLPIGWMIYIVPTLPLAVVGLLAFGAWWLTDYYQTQTTVGKLTSWAIDLNNWIPAEEAFMLCWLLNALVCIGTYIWFRGSYTFLGFRHTGLSVVLDLVYLIFGAAIPFTQIFPWLPFWLFFTNIENLRSFAAESLPGKSEKEE